ncbi:hypothetical protein KAT92_04485 [Candidatus Babeliales bacterium]|nr:hypothetical protein [Candidatus Babeliales bacterium]
MIEKTTEFLITQGSLGVLALFGMAMAWKVWKIVEKRNRDDQELISRLVEENRRDREKHDEDRDQWLEAYRKLANENTKNQERIASTLDRIEHEQERFYAILNK